MEPLYNELDPNCVDNMTLAPRQLLRQSILAALSDPDLQVKNAKNHRPISVGDFRIEFFSKINLFSVAGLDLLYYTISFVAPITPFLRDISRSGPRSPMSLAEVNSKRTRVGSEHMQPPSLNFDCNFARWRRRSMPRRFKSQCFETSTPMTNDRTHSSFTSN